MTKISHITLENNTKLAVLAAQHSEALSAFKRECDSKLEAAAKEHAEKLS
jgi:hypothetical protein